MVVPSPPAPSPATTPLEERSEAQPRRISRRILGRAFGHGKVILLGEHAVVYGKPALAAGLSLGLSAEVTDGTGVLAAPDWGLQVRTGDATPIARAWTAMLEGLGVDDVDVRVEGPLPTRAGLGSSAAMAVAVSRAIAVARHLDLQRANEAAAAAEVVFHGTPSGIDLAAALSGGVGRFVRELGWQPIHVLQPMTLCVGLSGRGHDTRALIESVRRLRDRTPPVRAVIDTLGDLATGGEAALASGDVDGLGRLFDVAHGLLAALRLSTPELDTLVHVARKAGAVGAKLTGAGGGGAAIALAPGHEQDVMDRWRTAGFEGFVAQIGGGAATANFSKAAL